MNCFSYVLMISLDPWNKMADYLINQPFCSDDFISSYKNCQKLEKQVIDLIMIYNFH